MNEKKDGVRPVVGAVVLVALIVMAGAIMNKIHRDRMTHKTIPTKTVVAEEANSFLETPTPTTGVVSGQEVKESDLGSAHVHQTVNPGIKE